MRTEEEIRKRLALIEECVKLGFILQLKADSPIKMLQAFCDLLRWVLGESP